MKCYLLLFIAFTCHAEKTLLEHANVKLKMDLPDTALILIDYQNEYLSGALPLFEIENAVAETKKLLHLARRIRMPVIHVLHKGTTGGLFDVNHKNGQEISDLQAHRHEAVIYKTLPNAFAATDLKAILDRLRKKHLIIAGLMSHMCLSSTVRAAIDYGYVTAVVASTTTTRDLRGIDNKVLKASDIKKVNLAELQDRFAIVLATPEDIKE